MARFNRRDTIEPRQLLFEEPLISGQVRHHDAQPIIARPGHQVAFEHFGPTRDCFGEAVERLLLLPLQLDRDENADGEADRLLIQHGDVARDDPVAFQDAHAAQTRRWR